MADIFISFRTDDTARVRAIYDGFRARGLSLFWSNDIPKGASNYQAIIKEEILKAHLVVVVWTSASVQSGPVIQECSQAEKANKLIQVLLDDIEPIDMPMEVRYKAQKTLLLGWTGDRRHPEWLKLNEAIDTRLERRQVATSDSRVKVDAKIVHGAMDGWLTPGAGKLEWFKDDEQAPEMVVVPAGNFMMGSSPSEIAALSKENYDSDLYEREGPQHNVTIRRPFAISRHAITRGQLATFLNLSGHKIDRSGMVGAMVLSDPLGSWHEDRQASWRNPGFPQTDEHPAVCVSWNDAQAYTKWLTANYQRPYRLLSEAEWEYAARAGTTTPYWWGPSINLQHAQFNGSTVLEDRTVIGEWEWSTVSVSKFAPNPWGLYQVHGNVEEWCADHWHDSYHGAPTDGSAWLQGGDKGKRVVRGGCWAGDANWNRAASRGEYSTDDRFDVLGFRIARTLDP